MPEKMETLYELIQPIIFAGGKGSRITQLLFGRPKCLMQVANKTLLQYTIEMLLAANIRQAIVIVLENELNEIQRAVKSMNLSDFNPDFITIPADSEMGTAESLRHIVSGKTLRSAFKEVRLGFVDSICWLICCCCGYFPARSFADTV